MTRFNVTYEIVTPESAEDGEAEDRGFISEDVDLREAISDLGWPSQGFEPSCSPGDDSRWITAYLTNDGTTSYYEDGEQESRSIHFPESMTPSSRRRVRRLIESGNYC